ncbi:hypothetical protein DUI87_30769 [Hirundo rustica rustica]|uniref:Uncharacterized protein n=1 Tax=Hirundo rustica rustica TaxID=333673 RepID=A0A3M0IW28_HIRRU|nr:hypothetical protein DUI87_30769 [Hirundo rustica rustica]
MAVDNNNFLILLNIYVVMVMGLNPQAGSGNSFASIRTFVTFEERLTSTIELQVKEEGAQEQVLEEMVVTNANEKAAILSLSMEPAPTLHDMLQMCARKFPFITAHQSRSFRVKPPQKAAAADTVLPVPCHDHHPREEQHVSCAIRLDIGHLNAL